MFSSIVYALLCLNPIIIISKTYAADLYPPSLVLYSHGEPEYTDILVKREGENLTLVCELKGDNIPRIYVWNYVPAHNGSTESTYTTEPNGLTLGSRLTKLDLQLSDSGHYMCSAPPFSVTKYILVQSKGPRQCSRGAFWCGTHCVLASYVCDGFTDCRHGEDEAVALCSASPCARADKLNCSSGRCISEAACCRSVTPLCKQHSCCDEHHRYYRFEGGPEVEFPPLFEDRHAPDDYGFIQSTIYTVTACALIFMIAVVLLVSAICKMHMKRTALTRYAQATRQHYNMQYAQAHRFPPCYEASRLLEQEARREDASPLPSTPSSPTAEQQCNTECAPQCDNATECEEQNDECRSSGFGLARLSAIFSSRYRQVPTQCLDVEMTDVRSASLNSSPTRNRTRLDNYRSPTYCDLNTDFFFNPETSNCGRDLNYMATPVEFYRRRTLRNNLDRIIDQINRPRPLTLQLGRFQLSIPRLGRRASLDRRPDTPNVAELTIDDLDFVRLNSNDTYTLNGRTIRLLGANFENYPVLENSTVRPPPYTEAMRYKLYGPPPEYLSRDRLNTEVTVNEEQARNNVEMPPCYDELAAGVDGNCNVANVNDVTNGASCATNGASDTTNVGSDVTNAGIIVTNGASYDTNGASCTTNGESNLTNNATNVTGNVTNINGGVVVTSRSQNAANESGNVTNVKNLGRNDTNGSGNVTNVASNVTNGAGNVTNSGRNVTNITNANSNVTNGTNNVISSNVINNVSDNALENLSSVIDNLPAIDSDVNANETDVIYNVNNGVNNSVNNNVC